MGWLDSNWLIFSSLSFSVFSLGEELVLRSFVFRSFLSFSAFTSLSGNAWSLVIRTESDLTVRGEWLFEGVSDGFAWWWLAPRFGEEVKRESFKVISSLTVWVIGSAMDSASRLWWGGISSKLTSVELAEASKATQIRKWNFWNTTLTKTMKYRRIHFWSGFPLQNLKYIMMAGTTLNFE